MNEQTHNEGTITPTPGWNVKHVDRRYDDPRLFAYPGGIEISPHDDGPEFGWFWRIDRSVAELGNRNDWEPGGNSPEDAFTAAVKYLIGEAVRYQELENALFAPGVYSADEKLAVLDRFMPRFVPVRPVKLVSAEEFEQFLGQIRAIAAQADALMQRSWSRHDEVEDEEWEALIDAYESLDASCGSGLALGKYLQFQVADGDAVYIIDRIDETRVHVLHIPMHDGYTADPVDGQGWCLRSVAEENIRRREASDRG